MKLEAVIALRVVVPFESDVPELGDAPPGVTLNQADYPSEVDPDTGEVVVDGGKALEDARQAVMKERAAYDKRRDQVSKARVAAAKDAQKNAAAAVSAAIGSLGDVVDVRVEEVREA